MICGPCGYRTKMKTTGKTMPCDVIVPRPNQESYPRMRFSQVAASKATAHLFLWSTIHRSGQSVRVRTSWRNEE